MLVPLNWLLFRLIGRVEWAWVAAPVIADGRAVAVVRLAQLDIGFARSRTEIAVLELQAGYPRAHVTRYTALYTSLSRATTSRSKTRRRCRCRWRSTPVSTANRSESPNHVELRRDSKTRLAGFQVRSNSTGMIHSEQMFDARRRSSSCWETTATGFRLVNGTELELRDCRHRPQRTSDWSNGLTFASRVAAECRGSPLQPLDVGTRPLLAARMRTALR